MKQIHINEAAALLVAARASGQRMSTLPEHCMPADVAEAYAIQDAVSESLGAIGGWKVGASGPEAEPACAPIPSAVIYAAPCDVPPPGAGEIGVEAEIAFRLNCDLPPRDEPYTREDVVAAIASVHPAVELVTFRFSDPAAVSQAAILADAAGNGGFIFGTGRRDAVDLEQTEQPVQLEINERMVCDTIGGNAAGDVLRLVVWLANHVAARSGGLRAGQFVTTGTCSGLEWVAPGGVIKAAFAGLGSVSLTITDDAPSAR